MAARGCSFWLAQLAVGCAGMLLGSALVIGAQVYAAYKVAEQVSKIAEEQRAKGPDPGVYEAMCSNGAESRSSLKATCERMRKEIEEHRAAEASRTTTQAGDRPYGSGVD